MKKKSLTQTILLCALVAAVTVLINCSSPSEEDLLRQSIENAADHAEDNDLERTMEYISADYSDDQDRKVEDIAQLLESYLGKYRGIAVNLLGIKIKTFNPPRAHVETDIGLSSGAAQVFRKVSRYAGYFYRFKLDMVKSGKKWLVHSASWDRISQQELNPEAAEKLKKLFPNM